MANTIEIIFKGKNLTGQTIGEVNKSLDALGQKMTTIGNTMTLGVTAPLVGIGVAAVKAASDLEESMSKVDVVFGESSDAMMDWSETAATAMGLSQQKALEAAGTYGNLFRAMGLTEDASAGMSRELVQLASDLASFNNMKTDEVLEKLRAGLTGEAEPLKTLGINMNQARLEAKALELGLISEGQALDAAAKAQAAYAIMLEDTALAQGDFARTSDGLANSMRTAQASIQDVLADLGESLLPVVTKLAKSITALAQAFSNLPEGMQSAIVNIGLFLAAVGPLLSIGGKIVSLVGALGGLGGVTAGLGSAFSAVAAAASAAGGAIASAGAAVLAFISGPVALLIAAIGILTVVIIEFGPQAWETFKMLAEIVAAVFDRMLSDILNWSKQIGVYLIRSISGLTRDIRSWAKNIGLSFVYGIGEGVNSAWNWLMERIKSLALSILEAAKSTLEASSPSKLAARQLGLPIAQGIGLGFEQGMSDLSKQIGGGLAGMIGGGGRGFAMAGATNYNVGTVRYYGSFSADEMAMLDRREDKRTRRTIERVLR